MDEKETNKKPDTTTETENRGNKPEAKTLIDEANAAAERMENANERKAELIRQEEELAAKRALGGRSEAGQAPVKEEISDEEYANRVMRGEDVKK